MKLILVSYFLIAVSLLLYYLIQLLDEFLYLVQIVGIIIGLIGVLLWKMDASLNIPTNDQAVKQVQSHEFEYRRENW